MGRRDRDGDARLADPDAADPVRDGDAAELVALPEVLAISSMTFSAMPS